MKKIPYLLLLAAILITLAPPADAAVPAGFTPLTKTTFDIVEIYQSEVLNYNASSAYARGTLDNGFNVYDTSVFRVPTHSIKTERYRLFSPQSTYYKYFSQSLLDLRAMSPPAGGRSRLKLSFLTYWILSGTPEMMVTFITIEKSASSLSVGVLRSFSSGTEYYSSYSLSTANFLALDLWHQWWDSGSYKSLRQNWHIWAANSSDGSDSVDLTGGTNPTNAKTIASAVTGVSQVQFVATQDDLDGSGEQTLTRKRTALLAERILQTTSGGVAFSSYNTIRDLTPEIYNAIYDVPTATDDLPFWTYLSVDISAASNYTLVAGNWSIPFPQVTSTPTYRLFYYNPETVASDAAGDWGAFNYLRNILVAILNISLLIFQFIIFLLVAAFNILLWMPIALLVLPFLINVVARYAVWGLVLIAWYAYEGILGAWTILVWIWETWILPGLKYLWNDILVPILEAILAFLKNLIVTYIPLVMDWLRLTLVPFIIINLIKIFSALVASVLYLATVGAIDWSATYSSLLTINIEIFDAMSSIFETVAANIITVTQFVGLYVTMIMLMYVKVYVLRARGISARARALEESISVYIFPFTLAERIIKWIKGVIPAPGFS